MRTYPIAVIRRHYNKVARQLCYDERTFKEIAKAETENEIARIMERARLRKVKFDYELDTGRR